MKIRTFGALAAGMSAGFAFALWLVGDEIKAQEEESDRLRAAVRELTDESAHDPKKGPISADYACADEGDRYDFGDRHVHVTGTKVTFEPSVAGKTYALFKDGGIAVCPWDGPPRPIVASMDAFAAGVIA